MASLAEYRAKYPQYNDLSDEQLADGLHRKYYSDIPKEEFYGKIGFGGAPKPKMDRGTAAATGVADAVTFNNTDEFGAPLVSGAVKALGGDFGGAARDVGRAFGGLDVLGMINPMLKPAQDVARASTEASPAEQGAREAIQNTQQQAFKDRPATYLGSQVAATVAIPSASAERGLNWGARTGLAALEGGSLGAKYAEGAAPDGEKGDLGRIATGAAFGAGGGAAGAQLAPVVSWAGKTAGNALQVGMPKFNPNQTNSLFGAMDNSTGPASTPRPTVRQGVRSNVVKSAVRSGLTPENVAERVQPWREVGSDPLVAQALGEPGLQRAQTLASLPGKTPQVAADTIKAVRDKSPTQILDAVNEAFPITTRMKAQGAIDEGFDQASAVYRQVLSEADDASVSARLDEIEPILGRMPDEVRQLAEGTLARLAKYDGLDPNRLNLAQRLHYQKRALGQIITGMKREGLQADEVRSLTRLAQEYTKKLDEVIPGYQPVRARWGDLSEAEEALTWADDFFGKARPDELKAGFEEMTPFQKENALIGIANEIKRRVASGTKEGVRKKNIADQFLNKEFADKLRSVLGDTEAEKLVKVLNLTDRDFNELSSLIPRGNSKTVSVFGDMIDQAQAAPPVNKQGVLDLAAVPFRYGWNKATNALLESGRNKEGAEMFSTFTPEKQTALEEALRQYYANRSAATRAAMRGGNAGGVAGGSAAGQQ